MTQIYESEATCSYLNATGAIRFTITNDYMFKIIFQNTEILSAFICALLRLEPKEIKNIQVNNPIQAGEHVDEKTFILDISITLNNALSINIEMQVNNYDDWTDRSLSYLCRSFDRLCRGESYSDTTAALHISILDFTLFPEYPEFYGIYKFINVKNHHIYNDKFQLNVLELNQIQLATDEDKAYGLDKWAALFKAKMWEEVKKLAADNQIFDAIAQELYQSNSDEKVRRECEAREEYYRRERRTKAAFEKLQKELEESAATIASKDATIASLQEQNQSQDATIASQDATIASRDATIASLQEQNQSQDATIATQDATIASLQARLAQLEAQCSK